MKSQGKQNRKTISNLAQKSNNTYKFITLGDSGVGKTTLLQKLKTGQFKEQLPVTIDLQLITFYDYQVKGIPETFSVWIYDSAGRYQTLFKKQIQSKNAVIIVISLQKFNTLSMIQFQLNLKKYIGYFVKFCDQNRIETKLRYCFLGSKLDLVAQQNRQAVKKIFVDMVQEVLSNYNKSLVQKQNIENREVMIDVLSSKTSSNQQLHQLLCQIITLVYQADEKVADINQEIKPKQQRFSLKEEPNKIKKRSSCCLKN